MKRKKQQVKGQKHQLRAVGLANHRLQHRVKWTPQQDHLLELHHGVFIQWVCLLNTMLHINQRTLTMPQATQCTTWWLQILQLHRVMHRMQVQWLVTIPSHQVRLEVLQQPIRTVVLTQELVVFVRELLSINRFQLKIPSLHLLQEVYHRLILLLLTLNRVYHKVECSR